MTTGGTAQYSFLPAETKMHIAQHLSLSDLAALAQTNKDDANVIYTVIENRINACIAAPSTPEPFSKKLIEIHQEHYQKEAEASSSSAPPKNALAETLALLSKVKHLIHNAWTEMGYSFLNLPKEILCTPAQIEKLFPEMVPQNKALESAWPRILEAIMGENGSEQDKWHLYLAIRKHHPNIAPIETLLPLQHIEKFLHKLSASQIRTLFKTVPELKNRAAKTEALHFAQLELERVPHEIPLWFPNIKKFDLGANRLTDFPFRLQDFPCLNKLSLRSNQLTRVPFEARDYIEGDDLDHFLTLWLMHNRLKAAPPYLARYQRASANDMPTHYSDIDYNNFYPALWTAADHYDNPLLFNHHQNIAPFTMETAKDFFDSLLFFQFQMQEYSLDRFPELPARCLSRFYFALLQSGAAISRKDFDNPIDPQLQGLFERLPSMDRCLIESEIKELKHDLPCSRSQFYAAVHNTILRKYDSQKTHINMLGQVERIESRLLGSEATPEWIRNRTHVAIKERPRDAASVIVSGEAHNLPRLALALDLGVWSAVPSSSGN